MWFIAALASAAIYPLKGILEKKFVSYTNPFILAFGVRSFALPFFVVALILFPESYDGVSKLPLTFWLATIYVSCVSTPLEMIFFYKALKQEELTYLMPLFALSPLLTAIFNMIIFHDVPSLLGLTGIMCIIAGIYTLEVRQFKEGLLDPFKALYKNQAVRFMLPMLFLYSLGLIVDKIALQSAHFLLYSCINYLLVSISLLMIALIKAPGRFHEITTRVKGLSLIGVIIATYTILRMIALNEGNAGYISAIMSTSILFTMLFGAFILKEKNMRAKIISSLLIVLGLVLIKNFG